MLPKLTAAQHAAQLQVEINKTIAKYLREQGLDPEGEPIVASAIIALVGQWVM